MSSIAGIGLQTYCCLSLWGSCEVPAQAKVKHMLKLSNWPKVTQSSTSLTRDESDWSGAHGSNEASSKSTRDSLNLLQRFYTTARHNLVPSGVLTWNHDVKNQDGEKSTCCDRGQWKEENGGGRGPQRFHANTQNDFFVSKPDEWCSSCCSFCRLLSVHLPRGCYQ